MADRKVLHRAVCPECRGRVEAPVGGDGQCPCGHTGLDGAGRVWRRHGQKGVMELEPNLPVTTIRRGKGRCG